MEKTVFKMLAVTGVVIGLGMASLPLSSFAADSAESSDNLQVNVVIANHIALDTTNTKFHGGFEPADLDSAELGINSMVESGMPSDINNDPRTGLWTGIQSSVPYQISISSDAPDLVLADDANEKIPANANVQAGISAWAVKANAKKSYTTGLTDVQALGRRGYEPTGNWLAVGATPQILQTGPATRDTTADFVDARFVVGISTNGNQAPGNYSGNVTLTGAAQP